MMAPTVIDQDAYRCLTLMASARWEVCDVAGAEGVVALLRPVHDVGGFRANLLVCRDEVDADVSLDEIVATSARHLAARYPDIEERGSEPATLGSATAQITMRVFDIGEPGQSGQQVRRVNQLQAVIDAGVDDGVDEGTPRVIYQLIATVDADHAADYVLDLGDLIGGATVDFTRPPTSPTC